MEITTTWIAIRTDRAVPAAHGGALTAAGSAYAVCGSTKLRSVASMGTFAGQESNPPREESG